MKTITESLVKLARAYSRKTGENDKPLKLISGMEIGKRVSIERTVTDDDVTKFAQLTDDFNPIHIVTPVKIVHGALLNGFLSGVLGTKLPGPGTIVIEQLIRYPKACYVGDTIEITVEILSARKIITCKYSIIANSVRTVLEGEGKFVMRKLDSS